MRVLVPSGLYRLPHVQGAGTSGTHPFAYDNLRTGHRWAAKWGPFEGQFESPLKGEIQVYWGTAGIDRRTATKGLS